MESVVRSISLSYSGNLVAFTTTKITKTQPQLAIIDIRDSEKSFVLTNTVSAQSDCCIFSHLDDAVVIGIFIYSFFLNKIINTFFKVVMMEVYINMI